MTTDKTFKRRVRERMAATGERYTTARRALLDVLAEFSQAVGEAGKV